MTPIIVILLLIIISGVFVMAEMALVSARKTRLQQMADEGRSGARTALDLASNPDRFLSTTQVFITVVGILMGAYGERTLTNRLTPQLDQITTVAPYSETVAFVIVVVLIAYLTLVLGELVPKRLGLPKSVERKGRDSRWKKVGGARPGGLRREPRRGRSLAL